MEKEDRAFLDTPLLERWSINWEVVLYGLILAFAIATRFWDLGSRAQHHDESMHAFYSWQLAQGRGYTHNPLLHGPFLFHITALVYFLFGASDYTARVAPALFGVALVFMPYFLRKWLGRYGALATSFMLAISPGFLYFSRFIRHDIFAAFGELLLFIAIISYLERRAERHLYLTAAALGYLFCTKEVSYITTLIFGTFLLGVLVWELWRGKGRPLQDFASFDLIIVIGTLCLPLFSAFIISFLGWDPLDYSSLGIRRSAPVLLGLLAASVVVGLAWDPRRWPVAAVSYYAIYFLFHTTLLTNMLGIATGLVGSLGYWLAQQGVKRGGQPWYYYLILLPLYEFLPLFLALWGGVRHLLGFGGEAREEEGESLPWASLFPKLLGFWVMMAFIIYSWAGEKMPWLILHLALPITLLAGYTLGQMLEGINWAAWRERGGWKLSFLFLLFLTALVVFLSSFPTRGFDTLEELNLAMRWMGSLVILVGLLAVGFPALRRLGVRESAKTAFLTTLALLALFTIRYAFIASYIHGDIAKDMLIYTQTSPDVTMVVREIEQLSERLVGGEEMTVAFDDFTSWPFNWYLRDYPNRIFLHRCDPPQCEESTLLGMERVSEAPVVMVGLENESLARPYLTDYVRQQYRLRWWFPEGYRGMSWERVKGILTDPQSRHNLWLFLFHRELEKPLGSSDFAFYIRRDVVSRLWRSSAVPLLPAVEEYEERRMEMGSLQEWGGPGTAPGLLSYPKDMALDGEGNIYVVDSGNHRIQVFDPEGQVVTLWGEQGSAPGEFQEPWGVALDGEGNVYVADTWNHRIQKFDPQGGFLKEWGGFADTGGEEEGMPGLFYGPRDLVVDAQGNVYVTDTGNHRIQKFDPQGQFLGQWGGEGSGPGQFREPVGIAVDGEGNIYVADTWNRRIQKFDREFNFLAQWRVEGWESTSALNKPYLALDHEGYIYLTDPEGYRVLVLGREGRLLAFFGRYGDEGSSLNLPIGIAVDGEGYIYLADSANHRIVKFGPFPER